MLMRCFLTRTNAANNMKQNNASNSCVGYTFVINASASLSPKVLVR